MFTFLSELFNSSDFMPHGHCYLWLPEILWLHVVSDAIIALAYFSIPAALIYLVKRRRDLAFNWIFVMFGVFILACGLTHVLAIWTVWDPIYRLDGIIKAITALASISTAYLVWPLLPKAIALPTTKELEIANANLKSEISERLRVEAELFAAKTQLEHANQMLNRRVEEGVQKIERSQEELRTSAVKLEKSVVALELSEKRFQILSEQIPQLVWMSSPDGADVHFNSRWMEYTGQQIEKGSEWGWMDAIPRHEVEETKRRWRQSIQTGEMFEMEYPMRAKDGSYRWHLGRALPLRDEKGVVLQWYGTSTDIDDQRRANEVLEDKVKERTALLLESNKELEAFSNSVSHDLRSPLRHISGFADMLNRRVSAQLDETSKRHLQTIRKAADDAGNLVDDLLNFSRIGRLEVRKDKIVLSDVVLEAKSQLEREADLKEKISWNIEDPLPVMAGDRAMLVLVFVNLLSNAVKYSRHSERPEVSVYRVPSHDEIVIAVRDNGVGFDMKYADRLFGIFQRLHREDEFEGTGIGLANVKRIVTKHAGRVWAESAVDRGATFFVAFPLLDGGGGL